MRKPLKPQLEGISLISIKLHLSCEIFQLKIEKYFWNLLGLDNFGTDIVFLHDLCEPTFHVNTFSMLSEYFTHCFYLSVLGWITEVLLKDGWCVQLKVETLVKNFLMQIQPIKTLALCPTAKACILSSRTTIEAAFYQDKLLCVFALDLVEISFVQVLNRCYQTLKI